MSFRSAIRLVLLLILLGGGTSALAVRPHPEQNLYNRDFRQVMSGMRTYDPIAGNWLSYDPVWNERDPNYLTFCGGNPIGYFDSDGRCVEGTIAGWNSAPVPANASSAFMAGYYGGGVTSGFAEGWNGGSQIVDNTLTFGATDALGLTDTSQLQGSEYTDSRILANIGRTSLLTAATFGTAALAQGGSQAALYGYQGLQIYNAGSSGYSIGTGINQVANGNNWGYLNIAGGTLGVVGSTSFAAGNPTLNSLAGVGPSSGGFAQGAVTWWNAGSEGDAAFQNLSIPQQIQSEIGQNAVSGTSTSGRYAEIGGNAASAAQKGANILQGGNPIEIFGLNLPQTVNLLGTGPSAGVRLYVPPAAFIGAGAINVINSATSP